MMVAHQRAIVKQSILYGFSDPPASASSICIFFAIHWMEHTTWSNKRESTNKPHGMRSEVFLGWCFLDFRDFAARPRWCHDSAWFSDANTMGAITSAIYECRIINKANRTDHPPEPQFTHQPYTWPKNLLFSKTADQLTLSLKFFRTLRVPRKTGMRTFDLPKPCVIIRNIDGDSHFSFSMVMIMKISIVFRFYPIVLHHFQLK